MKVHRQHIIKKGKKNSKYFEKMAGVLKTKGKLTQAILEERAKDKERERT